ncbi:sulfotransferase [soil metagenome]
MQKVTVLYVAGTGRSGSTLLGNILGQVPGFFSGGEINNLFKRGMVENWYCGCRERFNSCPVWSEVVARAYGPEKIDPQEMVDSLNRLNRVRHIPSLLLRSRRNPDRLDGRAQSYLERLDRLYCTLGETTGARAIVDSSKSPAYGHLLGMLPSVDLVVVHLVRDPRGTAFSWRKKVIRSDGASVRPMQRMSLLKSSALWSVWNLTAEAMWTRSPVPYLRLRYEDLVADPARSVNRVLELAGAKRQNLGFIGEGCIALDAHHTISGNPIRLKTGNLELKPDLEWASEMPHFQRLVVTALTAHSLVRYGYRLGRSQQFSLSRLS